MEVTRINIYPIKSTAPIALSESDVAPRGLPWDRRWMLVDEQCRFITARRYPALVRVRTSIQGDSLSVCADGRPEIRLPLVAGHLEAATVSIWDDVCAAVFACSEADAWFSDYLGLNCRLVQMTDEQVRPVGSDYGRAGDEVSFADRFPLLLLSEASLDDLNGRLDSPVSPIRFRPNLVVDGSQPFDEDYWKLLRIGEVEFEGAKNSDRCILTTVDPDTGIRNPDKEPLRTLSSYRRRPEGGVFFGQNLIPRTSGRIRVGDALEIVSRW